MSPLKHLSNSNEPIEPEYLDHFFPPTQQRTYISALLGRGGLTRRRAECFVRLWAYLLLKQQQELGTAQPESLTQLYPTEGFVACTHREASGLFYGHKDRGSDRAAGMMVDQLVALGLLEKRFDGQSLCIKIRPLPELVTPSEPAKPVELKPDIFNPRTDAIPIASLIAQTYIWATKDESATPQRIARILRSWSQEYPTCLRVLRRCDNLNPVGIAILYPTAGESEEVFFRPPAKSFYLTSNVPSDPVKMAYPGDPDCTSVYVRAWYVDMAFMHPKYLAEFLKDTQETLAQIQADFPNLCDIYSPVIHPLYEELRMALGFQRTNEEHRPWYWVYLSIDRYLELDCDQVVKTIKIGTAS
ncbi:hypothetical protein K9N68_32845 [Kovacikia minuta CCNUW1]|uniref:hypothetical protein n=1 Tax=Kovacikia minuta TaxID=2931930 RepID=UPI001CCABA22|nr:hypothetical protein [Kovacikia minuta]UBF26243.1 hypothetical protein K9N68_32845 [Kovacikia minuta CCNUW1]